MISIILACLLAGASLATATKDYHGYKVLRITPTTDDHVAFLRDLDNNPPAGMELDFWMDVSTAGNPVDINVSPKDRPVLESELKARSMFFVVFIDDVQKEIDGENDTKGSHAYSNSGFDYGQYHSLRDIQQEIRNLQRDHAKIATLIDLGSSYERRRIEAIKVSLDSSANKKMVFIDCGIHAREWISPATCMYFLNKILTSYKYDSTINQALTDYDIVVLPVFNVDGYEYSRTSNRMWRKTRSYHQGCSGADPNRNWDYKWGGAGTSPRACADTYHGQRAFSEIEVVNVARYLYANRHLLKAYYNIHAYSQMWLTPWSYTKTRPSDYDEIKRVARIGCDALSRVSGTRYTYGPPPELLYAVAGGSIDWTYGVLGVTYSYALELRDKGRHGFILPASQIIPTGKETTVGLIAAINAMK